MVHTFIREQALDTDLETAWKFFSSPKNLAVITPPEMDFTIVSDLPEGEIVKGLIIRYTVRPLFAIPLPWTTEITEVERPFKFVDNQVRGPYRLWEHTHVFKEQNGGVQMTDVVRYELPLGLIGEIVHKLTVKQKLNQIFEFRRITLEKMFNSKRSSSK